MSKQLPDNVHVSRHPCLQVKLAQLRSAKASSRETNDLVHEIATIIGCEAFADNISVAPGGKNTTPLGYEYTTASIMPEKIALVPILRSGLGMVQAIQTLLPCTPAVHHLGLFREPTTLEPVEYYNNLPFQPSATGQNSAAAKLAIIIDPVVATGSTASAAIQTLKEWGVERILFLCVLGSYAGLVKAAGEWKEGVQVWTGAVDAQVDVKGMIQPGLGDIGDRLFSAGGRTC
ncbi:putative uracil phosphoribosyltransferase [Microsporum canis]|uniref:uracil phosphoribosyltransferase n=1 Tax=Arthroderma otae (strain ATCC MYA-4605 / CBS 113480) TaxID=554155 RepID=C5FMA4_ARTOC|nr:uracil phosphoribosyltransferase [Microsporum canis CBS 113480]EEQ31007.1 uracil phosphoribosyltransferase [Microsporum canis CBS 113480]